MALSVLANTKNMSESEWLELRNKGIGGSDAAAAVGLSPYKSPMTLWMEKTGQIEPDDLSENESVYWGKTLEDIVAVEFAKRTGIKVRRCNFVLVNPEYPFMLANVDRTIVGHNEGLECKNIGIRAAKLWEGDEVPDIYYLQCQHYCAVTGWDGVHIAALVAGQKFINKYIPRNDEFIKNLIEQEKVFWDHVVNKTIPNVDNSEACCEALRQLYPSANGREITLPDTAELWAKRFNRGKELEEQGKAMKQEAQNTLQMMLGDNEMGKVAEFKVVWSNVSGRSGFDTDRLQKEMPDIYKKYFKPGKPTRRFSLK